METKKLVAVIIGLVLAVSVGVGIFLAVHFTTGSNDDDNNNDDNRDNDNGGNYEEVGVHINAVSTESKISAVPLIRCRAFSTNL